MQTSRRRLPTHQSGPHRRRAQAGVALFEVLISILIFSLGLLGLIGLEATAINLSGDAEDRSRAALLASEIASSMWINNSVVPTAAQNAIWQSIVSNPANPMGLPGGAANATLTIATTPGTTNSADITIHWLPVNDKGSIVRTLTTRVILP